MLITGASSGLGEEFAWQLAALGYNLLLVARRTDKLKFIQKQLVEKYPQQQYLTLYADLNELTSIDSIYSFIEKQEIQLIGLINNAGFGARGKFAVLNEPLQQEMIQVNISALTQLTHRCIPNLKADKRSFIINVASTAAFQAGPNLALYYASKAYVLSFSEALHEELKGKISVSALCPGATKTEFSDVAGMSDSFIFKLRVMDKSTVVNYALKNRDRAVVVPGLINQMGVIVVKLLPRFISRKLAYQIQK